MSGSKIGLMTMTAGSEYRITMMITRLMDSEWPAAPEIGTGPEAPETSTPDGPRRVSGCGFGCLSKTSIMQPPQRIIPS